MSAEMACSKCALEARLSGGDGSRITLDTEKLQRDGWSVEKKGKSYVFFSPSPEKKRFKSSSDVAAHLQNNNMLTLFTRCDCGSQASQNTGEESSGSEEEEYLPETEDETGVSSAYDETPVKEAQERPREAQTHAPIPKR